MRNPERNALLIFADEGRIANAIPAEVSALDSGLELILETDFAEALRLIASRGRELRAVVVARASRSIQNSQITNLTQDEAGTRAHIVPPLASVPDEGLSLILRSHIAAALGIPQGGSRDLEGGGFPAESACGYAGGGDGAAESVVVHGGIDMDPGACSAWGRGM